jgi:hypothetical protein
MLFSRKKEIITSSSHQARKCIAKGHTQCENSHKRWVYPCKFIFKFCKEASVNPAPPAPGHKVHHTKQQIPFAKGTWHWSKKDVPSAVGSRTMRGLREVISGRSFPHIVQCVEATARTCDLSVHRRQALPLHWHWSEWKKLLLTGKCGRCNILVFWILTGFQKLIGNLTTHSS